jgi:eukaryotic-like serine/threonine-protein kinase
VQESGMSMNDEQIIDDRFELAERIGAGGMGEVYCARDRQTDAVVALKLLLPSGRAGEATRFLREGQVLAGLRIPGVVQYVAHGVTSGGRPYLAMEWLVGETLSERIARRELTLAECVTLGLRVATTLGAVHRLGLVHRDLKPSNLFLVQDSVERVTLIDFGVVHVVGPEQQLTRTGSVLGTPGYMAPEQARGERQVDARADVFSLGCVLYRVLTCRDAFSGSGLGLFAKVLLDEPTRVRTLRPDIPERLDALVHRMLSKQRRNRPVDGMAVAAELGMLSRPIADLAVTGETGAEPSAMDSGAGTITSSERRLICLVLAQAEEGPEANTVSISQDGDARLAKIASRFQGDLHLLGGQSPLITLSGGGAATDLAARAALCALAVAELLGGRPTVLVMGRTTQAGLAPLEQLIDRAMSHLPSEGEARLRHAVCIDEVTYRLLGSRFEVTRDNQGIYLWRAREELYTTPQLLGRPMPCVGREREVSLLTAELRHCVAESTASAVLITGPAGLGKSRLLHEFTRTLRELDGPIDVWFGKGDPMSAGSAFGMLADALRRVMDLRDDEPDAVRQGKILARLSRYGSRGIDVPRSAAFLGEMLGVQFSDEEDAQLRAARRSPMVMSDQIREAWKDFVRAECADHPVVLLLEDLHWGDLPTTKLVDAALRHARDLPLLVIALGREGVDELFPELWQERQLQRIHLTPLPRRACERMAREVLGEAADEQLVAKLVASAAGNAFFLEEQIRAVAGGQREGAPETVLAAVQARLEGFDEDVRRVLRAASIFGETFWQDGVARLLGSMDVGPLLDDLGRREVLLRRPGGRLAGQVEYAFRHSLVREAAYGMLTERDLRQGHANAAFWLEQVGETDPLALGEHFDRGGERQRAAEAFLRAAEQSLRGDDLAAAIARTERGLACEPGSSAAGALRLVQAEAHIWRGDLALAEERAAASFTLLGHGEVGWFSAARVLITALHKQGEFDRVERCIDDVLSAAPAAGGLTAREMCLTEGAIALIFGGRPAGADALLEILERSMSDITVREPEVAAKLHQARAFRVTPATDPEAALAAFKASLEAFEQAGARRDACMASMNLGFCYSEIGDLESAEAALASALSIAQRMELQDVAMYGNHNLGLVLAERGRVQEGRALEEAALVAAQKMGDPRIEGAARSYLSRIALLVGDLATAEREALAALQVLDRAPPLRVFACALHARVLLARGRVDEALARAREAISGLTSLGTIDEGESLVRLVYAESLAASGHPDEAAAAITQARDLLLTRADKLRDPAHRERFLHGIADNARTLELARAFTGDALPGIAPSGS